MFLKLLKFLIITLIICSGIIANPVEQVTSTENDDEINKLLISQVDLMKSYMDPSAEACDDFYQYACGNFEHLHKIPDDKSYTDTWKVARDNVESALFDIVEDKRNDDCPLLKTTSSDSEDLRQKVINFYKSCMDEQTRNQHGSKPLLEFFQMIGDWPLLDSDWNGETFDWLDRIAKLRSVGSYLLILHTITSNLQNPDAKIITLEQASSQILSRRDYLSERNSTRLLAYEEFLFDLLILLDVDEMTAKKTVAEVIDFEIEIQKISMDDLEMTNFVELYKLTNISGLYERYPSVDWHHYFTQIMDRTLGNDTEVALFGCEGYLSNLIALLDKTEPRTIANHIFLGTIIDFVESLDERFLDVDHKLTKIITGASQKPLRESCMRKVRSYMSSVLDLLYLREHFNEANKVDIEEMVHLLKSAFIERLNDNAWMDTDTKLQSIAKMDAMDIQLGYEENFLNGKKVYEQFHDIEIVPDKLFENVATLKRSAFNYAKLKYEKPVNRKKWLISPSRVDAVFVHNLNMILFPAGILQPPFYHPLLPKALNFGGMGSVIGHEITHAYGDKGRKFDGLGKLGKWWTDHSNNEYDKHTQCFKDQYDQYTVFDHKLNGATTANENAADIGGVQLAFHVYQKWLEQQNDSSVLAREELPGLNLTNSQLFFLAYAQIWCHAIRPEAVITAIRSDPHAINSARVRGTASNSKEFAETFDCKPNDAMNPSTKCNLW